MSKRAYFGTDGIRGQANSHPMTAEVALRVGLAAAKLFKSQDERRHLVVIGKDTRLSGYMVESLKRLEYRGYDSAGLAAQVNGVLERRRAPGKLRELESVLAENPLVAQTGIGPSRRTSIPTLAKPATRAGSTM